MTRWEQEGGDRLAIEIDAMENKEIIDLRKRLEISFLESSSSTTSSSSLTNGIYLFAC